MQFQQHHRPIAGAVATQGVDVRREFIRKTYIHLGLAILAFASLSFLLYDTGVSMKMTVWVMQGQFNWLLVLALFMGASYIADRWARSDVSQTMQYIGLGLYIVAEAFIFAPILLIAAVYSDASILPTSITLTVFLFAGLTGTVFITKKDFSFLRGVLAVGGMVAMGMILCSILFGFQLGVVFAGAMILFAAAAILYQTSQIMAHYRPTQHVSASLGLFAAVALMFYYILMFFLSMSRN
ncbi:MAG TPA: Bax inhibitor-1 family protein [Kofleriaceae bacterium]|nr:Bax inhibitor-1 family protein [Kofleriaceae bacterium]